jgi:transcriptional regulator with XRE-family HTH domain
MEDIQERISLIISTKGMTNGEFAEAVNVQPSSISHIMSGRNKPSLDLVMKIMKRFPELRTDWLLNGKGAMNRESNLFDISDEKSASLFSKSSEVTKQASEPEDTPVYGKLKEKAMNVGNSQFESATKELQSNALKEKQDHRSKTIHPKKIEKILVFYEDKTFIEYLPSD